MLRGPRPSRTIPLDEVLVENSFYNRTKLKARLYEAGLRERQCQLCGQGERWNGRGMSLILDHINGVAIDNRLENLRIVCPNCAATLDTHCGRKNRLDRGPAELPAPRQRISPEVRHASVLLARLRRPQQRAAQTTARAPQGRAPIL